MVKKFYPILILCCFWSCKHKEFSIVFPSGETTVEIPFKYSYEGFIVTQVVIKDDTLQCIVDTGSDITIVPKDIKMGYRLNSIHGKDIRGVEREMPTVRLEEIQWGGIFIRNKTCAVSGNSIFNYEGIIGGDVLRNFCVIVDNVRKKIILSKLGVEINKAGEPICFNIENNSIKVDGVLGGEIIGFRFDTGFNLDLAISSNKNITISKVLNRINRWLEVPNSLFSNNSDTISYILYDFEFGTKTYTNSIVACYKNSCQNLIGTSFMRRFKTIVIDYPNSVIYFELPAGNQMMSFSRDTITPVPISYLEFLYQRINSMGMQFTDTLPFTLNALQEKEEINNLKVGDTLVGIDNIVFNQYALRQLKKSNYYSSFILEEDFLNKKIKLIKPFSEQIKQHFIFLKKTK